jgi:hypothetical protein
MAGRFTDADLAALVDTRILPNMERQDRESLRVYRRKFMEVGRIYRLNDQKANLSPEPIPAADITVFEATILTGVTR